MVVQRCFYQNGEKYYIYFIDSLRLFATVTEFSKSVNSWWSYRKMFDNTFFETQCRHKVVTSHKHTQTLKHTNKSNEN